MSKEEKKNERYILNSEEIQRFENYLELQTARKEVIGMLDKYSCSFADWSIIVSEAVHDAMAKKRQSNMDCENERKMLENLTFMFTKLAYFSEMLSKWHKEIAIGIENTKAMME